MQLASQSGISETVGVLGLCTGDVDQLDVGELVFEVEGLAEVGD